MQIDINYTYLYNKLIVYIKLFFVRHTAITSEAAVSEEQTSARPDPRVRLSLTRKRNLKEQQTFESMTEAVQSTPSQSILQVGGGVVGAADEPQPSTSRHECKQDYHSIEK